jgi:hypothetical protein
MGTLKVLRMKKKPVHLYNKMRIKLMNKKLLMESMISLLLTTTVANIAFAKKPFVHFDAIYMTDAYGSYTERATYAWDEIPWLYLRFPENGLGFNITRAWWESPGGDSYFTRNTGYNEQEIWLTLGDYWYEVRELGEWDIRARFFLHERGSHPVLGIGATSFHVIPEPVSSILFITGGATLVVTRYLRKRKIF